MLATVWDAESGRGKQKVLLNLRGAVSISQNMKEVVAANHPDVTVNWTEIQQALDRGPAKANEYQAVAAKLEAWASEVDTEDAQKLIDAAKVLIEL